MKNTILKIAMFAALCATSILSVADNTDKTYIGAQYAIGSYNEDGFSELNPTALVGRFGKYFNNNFAIEGRLGLGLQDDSLNFLGTDISLELDTLIGVYGVGHINLNETSSVYGIIGLTRAKATVSAIGFSDSASESGLSLGIGADIGIGNDVALNIEYIQYLNKSEFDFSAIGLGAVYSF